MSQVMNESPETLSKLEFGGHEASVIPPIGSPEHSALVDAVRLNFPEIYDAPEDANIGARRGEHVACSSPMPVPQTA